MIASTATFANGDACGALLLDLSKAFDTVNYEILLLILVYLGSKLYAVNQFESNLSS